MMHKSLYVKFLLVATLARLGNGLPMDSEVGRRAGKLPWTWNKQSFPNPLLDFEKCGQSEASTICDPDGVLTEIEATRLNDLAQRMKNTSPCLCKDKCDQDAHNKGLVVGVLIVKSIYHPYNADLSKEITDLSEDIMKQWKLGTCGNEVLIMIATDNKLANIAHGEAVHNFISEETLQEIFEQCQGHLASSHYYEGIESIINSLYDSVQLKLKAPSVNENDDGESKTGSVGMTVGLVVGIACIIGFIVAGVVVVRRKQHKRNQGGFMYDGSSSRPGSRNSKREAIGPIVKTPVVFPDAIYQPCSVEDTKKKMPHSQQPLGSDDEDDASNEELYLRNLEENPAYESADVVNMSRTLSSVQEGNEASPIGPVGVHRPNDSSSHKQLHSRDDKHPDAYA